MKITTLPRKGIFLLAALIAFLLPRSSSSQSAHYGPFATGSHYLQCLDILDSTSVNVHTGIRNFYRKDLLNYIYLSDESNADDLRKAYLIQDNMLFTHESDLIQKGDGYIKGLIYKTPANFFALEKKAFKLYLNPVLNISFGTNVNSWSKCRTRVELRLPWVRFWQFEFRKERPKNQLQISNQHEKLGM